MKRDIYMLKKTIKTITVILPSFFLFTCALSRAIYLGPSDYTLRPIFMFSNNIDESINGNFPEVVYIKTRTQSFNTYHYYILHDGLIWYKSIDSDIAPKDWTLFSNTGLPNSEREGFFVPSEIIEISADADELVALSAEGYLYSYSFDRTITLRNGRWHDRKGWPTADYFYFDQRISQNRSWALGKRNSHVLYWEDIFDNQHHYGVESIITYYVLLEDGQEICYGDPGLPSDFSRNFIGPERGAFIAESLSASASTMFVINNAGEMYTRLADFDASGFNPMFFTYTYTPYTSGLQGSNYSSHLNEWALPSEDWLSQTRIPLAGEAAITRHITILQNGHGNAARELRVAGLDEAGRTGYWSKPIFGDTWEFITVPLYFSEDSIIVTAVNNDVNVNGLRGLSPDRSYTGYSWIDRERENGWEYQIPNFNILEGDCDFLITFNGETVTLKLHPLEIWTYLKRDYLPGRTGSPKLFFGTLEIPENAFETLSHTFITLINEKFGQNHRRLFHYIIAATDSYIIMREINNTDSLFFLTNGTISTNYSEFHVGRYIENFSEVERYFSPELIIDNNSAITVELLTEKIELNRQFIDELKQSNRNLRWTMLTSFKFDASYLPAHYIVRITPLRFIDIPFRVTNYGDEVIKINSAYINAINEARIRLHDRIIEMLETRVRCYSDLLREISRSSTSTNEFYNIIPPYYSDNISDYWDIAGLPRTISGVFSYQEMAHRSVQIPALLSLIPSQSGQNVSGWHFAIADSNNFSIFIESQNSAMSIYSRSGRMPQQRRLEINGILYINEGASSPIEYEIIERCLRPFLSPYAEGRRGINVVIRFDGTTFEIREYPARRGNPLIFRGTI